MDRLGDVRDPDEVKSVIQQLADNTSVSVSGFPIPNKIEIKGHFKF